MTGTERKIAQCPRRLNAQWGGAGRAPLKDYATVYRDYCRADGDWSATFATRLYQQRDGEYCTLLEVLNAYYKDHRKQVKP